MHTHWRAHIHGHTYTHTHIHTHLHFTRHMHMCVDAHTNTDTCISDAYACTHYKHTLTHMHIPWCGCAHHTHTQTHTHTHTHSLQVREFWKILHLFAYRLHSGKCTAKERKQGLTDSQVAQLCRCRENGAKFSPLSFPEIVHCISRSQQCQTVLTENFMFLSY